MARYRITSRLAIGFMLTGCGGDDEPPEAINVLAQYLERLAQRQYTQAAGIQEDACRSRAAGCPCQ